jgi:hypothetical protein
VDEVVRPMAGPRRRLVDRLVAVLLLALMAAGSLALWLAVPAGFLWALSQLTSSSTLHFVVALVGVPLAMILFAAGLLWVNGLYLRVTGSWTFDETEDRPRRLRGPLEPLLLWSLLIAIVAMGAWFFFITDDPFGLAI